MKLTESQRQAVEHRGSNLLVSASAGSGKTEVLARRVVSLVSDPRQPADIERLLVVTFTRAAAAELRVRVARMLREAAADVPAGPRRAHLRRQAVMVDAAEIGTIDAWCGRLVRTHAAELGVDPGYEVLSEEEAHLLRQQVVARLFEWVYAADDETAAGARDWLGRHKSPDDTFLREQVLALNAFREHLVDVDGWLARQHRIVSGDDEALWDEAVGVMTQAVRNECLFQSEQLARLQSSGAAVALTGALEALRRRLEAWADALAPTPGEAPSQERFLEVVREIGAFRWSMPRGLDESAKALFQKVRERWFERRLRELWSFDAVDNILACAPAAAALVRTLLGLEACFHTMLGEAKRASARYEFSDVLRMALDLLGRPGKGGRREPTEIARRYQRWYEHVLVDEYQDTSPVQVEVLRLVTRDEPGKSNRFMVGDVKQSIYGFRQAEPRLFSRLVEDFAAGRQEGRVHYLADNFRSHPDLVEGLNRLFAMLFDPRLGGTPFAEQERLRAARTELENPSLEGRPRIELHVFEETKDRRGEEESEDEDEEGLIELVRVEREALWAAETIRSLLEAGVQVVGRGLDREPRLRPLRQGDVAVLLRSAKVNAGLAANVLRRKGLRCVTSGRDALLDAPEVRDVRNVLTLLVNRRQDVPLAAYLRSPMVGLGLDELLEVRRAAPRGSFYEAVVRTAGRNDSLGGKVREAMERLDRWGETAREQELPELLRRIYAETGWLHFARGLAGGEHRASLLRALERFAIEFTRHGRHGLDEFDAYLDDLASAELDPGVPVAAGEDAVQVMTIHASKGLEFPVVFLLNAGARFNRERGRSALQCHEELGLGLKFEDYPAGRTLVSARQPLIAREALARDLEEELRLLYVATTRAQECLYVCGHATEGTWDQMRAQFPGPDPPPLATRLTATSMLEWVMMGTSSAGLTAEGETGPRIRVETHSAEGYAGMGLTPEPPLREGPVIAAGEPGDDERWIRRGLEWLTARIDGTGATLPAVLSVSALKEAALSAEDADRSAVLVEEGLGLHPPAFAARKGSPHGREIGTACHRFLELADMTRLTGPAAVRAQLDELAAGGRLAPEEAAMVPVEDLAWFGSTPEAGVFGLPGVRIRREVPFVYAHPTGWGEERTIVRGVIDCLVETPAGLILFDYKTDRVRNEEAFARRVEQYTPQLQLYAQAAGRIFGRPVSRAVLVFLRARRVVEVACVEPPPLVAWLRREKTGRTGEGQD